MLIMMQLLWHRFLIFPYNRSQTCKRRFIIFPSCGNALMSVKSVNCSTNEYSLLQLLRSIIISRTFDPSASPDLRSQFYRSVCRRWIALAIDIWGLFADRIAAFSDADNEPRGERKKRRIIATAMSRIIATRARDRVPALSRSRRYSPRECVCGWYAQPPSAWDT